MNRTIARRLSKLESRLAPSTNLPEFVIRFIEPSGAVSSTLTLKDGRREWWYSETELGDDGEPYD